MKKCLVLTAIVLVLSPTVAAYSQAAQKTDAELLAAEATKREARVAAGKSDYTAERLFGLGQFYLAFEKYGAARERFREILEKHPNFEERSEVIDFLVESVRLESQTPGRR